MNLIINYQPRLQFPILLLLLLLLLLLYYELSEIYVCQIFFYQPNNFSYEIIVISHEFFQHQNCY